MFCSIIVRASGGARGAMSLGPRTLATGRTLTPYFGRRQGEYVVPDAFTQGFGARRWFTSGLKSGMLRTARRSVLNSSDRSVAEDTTSDLRSHPAGRPSRSARLSKSNAIGFENTRHSQLATRRRLAPLGILSGLEFSDQ